MWKQRYNLKANFKVFNSFGECWFTYFTNDSWLAEVFLKMKPPFRILKIRQS